MVFPKVICYLDDVTITWSDNQEHLLYPPWKWCRSSSIHMCSLYKSQNLILPVEYLWHACCRIAGATHHPANLEATVEASMCTLAGPSCALATHCGYIKLRLVPRLLSNIWRALSTTWVLHCVPSQQRSGIMLQLQEEAFASAFRVKHFHQFLYGWQLTRIHDHLS